MKYKAGLLICFGVLCLSTALIAQDSSQGANAGETPAPPAPSAQGSPKRVRVSQAVMRELLVSRVSPKYPKDARKRRIQGLVILKLVVSKEGDVTDATLISGPQDLAPAAIEAAKQWKYKPYILNGQPVEIEGVLEINFTLATG